MENKQITGEDLYKLNSLSDNNSDIVCWGNLFDENELKDIIEQCEDLIFEQKENNKCMIRFDNEFGETLFKKISTLIKKVNEEHFNFDLDGIEPNLLYIDKDENDKENWENNFASSISLQRKLCFVLCLSEPEDYSSGEVIFYGPTNPDEPKYVSLDFGEIIVFPTYISHKIDNVVNGNLKFIKGFVVGKKFK